MMNYILFALLFSLSLVFSEDKFPDLPKCALKDNECQKRLYEHVVQSIGKRGLPELGIPPVDPMKLRNVSVSVLGLLDITLTHGEATGVSKCVFNNFAIDLTKESGYLEQTCSLKIYGKYKLKSRSPLINGILGRNGTIRGDGNVKAIIDKIHLNYDFPVYAQKRKDGEIYMYCDYKRTIYNFDVQGGAKFFADHIYLGSEDISKEIISLINENWKFVLTSFGRPFVDKAMEFYFDYAGKFFNVVPARYYILDDLTPYARP